MKIKMMAIALLLTAALVLVAGCTSSGSNGGPGTATQSPGTASSSPAGQSAPSHPQSLTDAQKTQASNIAKDNSTVKDILSKSGYSMGGAEYFSSGDALTASIIITGGDTVHSDGSMWTLDQYTVIVDLDHNKVADIIHVAPKPLPTPKPTATA